MATTMYDRIRDLRIAQGMSQDDLAHAMGYKDRSMITKIEGGKVDISQKKIVEFAKVLNTTPRYLMDGDDEDAGEDEDVMALRQRLREDPQFRILFKTAAGVSKEDIQKAVKVLMAFQGDNDD